MPWYDKPIMYSEICALDMDYADECPSMIIGDYDGVFMFIKDRLHRFSKQYPSICEYYQIKGDWVAGDGIYDLYKENSKYGIIFHLYKRS